MVLVTKLANLSSISETHVVEREKQVTQVVHEHHTSSIACTHTQINTLNKQIYIKIIFKILISNQRRVVN